MEKKLAVFSTAYLPPIQYIQLVLEHKEILLEKQETFLKQTFRNRCRIYSSNGPLSLTIPVIKPYGNRTKIADIRIDNSIKWRKEHWRALESAYRSSAYFEYIADYFYKYYQKPWVFIWDYNLSLLETILSIFEVNVKLKETDQFIKNYPDRISDYRYLINPKLSQSKKQLEFLAKPYFQVFSSKMGFVPNLSVFDLICNCGMDSLSTMEYYKGSAI